jgi:hypothetical protein
MFTSGGLSIFIPKLGLRLAVTPDRQIFKHGYFQILHIYRLFAM